MPVSKITCGFKRIIKCIHYFQQYLLIISSHTWGFLNYNWLNTHPRYYKLLQWILIRYTPTLTNIYWVTQFAGISFLFNLNRAASRFYLKGSLVIEFRVVCLLVWSAHRLVLIDISGIQAFFKISNVASRPWSWSTS